MVIFLLTAVPVFYLSMDGLIFDLHGSIDDSYKPFAYGLISFCAGVILYNILRLALFGSPVFTASGLYIYHLLHDSLIQYLLGAAGYILVFGLSDFESSHHAVNRLFAFMCGYYCFWSINDLVINYGWYNNHLLLMIPFQRIGLIAAFSYLFSEALEHEGSWKVFFYLLCLLPPFVTAAGSLFWRLSMPLPALAVTAVLPAAAGIMLFRKLKPMREAY
jgi:hypothetical protein